MIEYRTKVHIFHFETQKEFANQMLKYIISGDMKDIIFNDNKERFMIKLSTFIKDKITEEIKKEIIDTYGNWIIILSTGRDYSQRDSRTDPEYVQSKVQEALERWENHTGTYPEYNRDWYYINRERVLEKKRIRDLEIKEILKKYKEGKYE